MCVSTGVLLCALRNVGFGDFFRLLNSDVRRNTYSLRKHWRPLRSIFWVCFFAMGVHHIELMYVANNIHSYVSPNSVL